MIILDALEYWNLNDNCSAAFAILIEMSIHILNLSTLQTFAARDGSLINFYVHVVDKGICWN